MVTLYFWPSPHSPPRIIPPARVCALLLATGFTGAVLAQSQYHTPLRGSAERADLLDAIRPLAQWAFDTPIEFVVEDMRVAGDAALVKVSAQRPGGAAIDRANSPLVMRDGETPELVDGPHHAPPS